MVISGNNGVHFQATLPLAWLPVSACVPFEAARYLAVLAEFEHSAEDRSPEQSQLHAKLDLALLWLARSLAGEMPAPCAAWVGLEWLSWDAQMPLAVGSTGALALNLSSALPFLLQLPATISACEQNGALWRVQAQLMIEDEGLRDGWERTVFRYHRRAIQQERGTRI